jgi:hypothetical protein
MTALDSLTKDGLSLGIELPWTTTSLDEMSRVRVSSLI